MSFFNHQIMWLLSFFFKTCFRLKGVPKLFLKMSLFCLYLFWFTVKFFYLFFLYIVNFFLLLSCEVLRKLIFFKIFFSFIFFNLLLLLLGSKKNPYLLIFIFFIFLGNVSGRSFLISFFMSKVFFIEFFKSSRMHLFLLIFVFSAYVFLQISFFPPILPSLVSFSLLKYQFLSSFY